jgi:predicted dehydrogenase
LSSPDRLKVVAIAEPRPNTRTSFSSIHNVDKTLVFNTWQELIVASAETISTIGKRLADAVIIALQDHQHLEATKAFAEQGYHLLCEKPMATTIRDCVEMESVVKKSGKIFGMGHGTCLRQISYNF